MIINNYWTIIAVIGVILAILIIIVLKDEEGFNKLEVAITVFLVEVILTLICFTISFIGTIIFSYTSTEGYTETSELVSINDYVSTSQKLQGAFFLGVGGFSGEGQSTYNVVYAFKDSDGTIRPKTQGVDKSGIGFKEDGTNTLEIRYKKDILRYNKVGKWLFNKDVISEYEPKAVDYIFHVPEKSIIKDSKIDLK